METTTSKLLSQAFVVAIHAIEPRHEHAAAVRWKYTPGGRERGQARPIVGAELRSFDLVWEAATPSYLWYGNGEAYTARLRIGTSYSGAPVEELEHMISADGVDLRKALAKLGEPTTPGLSHTVHMGVGAYEIDDLANVFVEHVFTIHWAQSTD